MGGAGSLLSTIGPLALPVVDLRVVHLVCAKGILAPLAQPMNGLLPHNTHSESLLLHRFVHDLVFDGCTRLSATTNCVNPLIQLVVAESDVPS